MATKRYDVCCPRPYKDGQGNQKTYFWKVGTAFPLKDRDGFSIQLYTRVLPLDELVCFVHQPRFAQGAQEEEEPEEYGDIPI